MKKNKIFTHVSVDIDAVCSLWFFLRFILKKSIKEVEIVFIPANWDGEEMEDEDVALDVYAGGKGIKGDNFNGRLGSCIQTLFSEHSRSIDKSICDSLKILVKFVNLHDSSGIKAWKKIPLIRSEEDYRDHFLTLFTVLNSYHRSNDDYGVCKKMFELLDNYLLLTANKIRVEEELGKVKYVGKVAIVDNARIHINNYLFNNGFKFVVYIDGFNLGILTKDRRLSADNFLTRIVIKNVGEKIGSGEGKWFAHQDGRLFCWGSDKSPAKKMSKVNPLDLAEAANSYIETLQIKSNLES